MHRGPLGTQQLNAALQQLLNPHATSIATGAQRPALTRAARALRAHAHRCAPLPVSRALGTAAGATQGSGAAAAHSRFLRDDRVINLVNDYDKGVFNGDFGIVASVGGGVRHGVWLALAQ